VRDTYTDWLVAYSRFTHPGRQAEPAGCPRCGAPDFGLVFMAAPDQPRGRAYFWCKNCLVGVRRYGALLTEGAVVIPLAGSADELACHVPDIDFVPGLE
jgi:hypothetical protein